MLRGNSLHKPTIFEDLRARDTFHFIPQDVENESGDIEVRYEYIVRKSNVPFTPQSGIETCINDISFMFRNNINISHEPSYLSIARNGNPFAQFLAVQQAAEILENSMSNDKK